MSPSLFACFRKGGSTSRNERKGKTNATVDVSTEEQRSGGAVLVELFSSQGCKTSPAAELVVSRLARGDFALERPVIVLAFHVDYWDYMGWKDPFGSSQWTIRQKAYVEALRLDTMFTPQIVVQGRAQCMGNDEDAMLDNINNAPRFPTPSFRATFRRPTSEALEVSLKGPANQVVNQGPANVMVALYESGIVTDCPQGENKGLVLSNDYVVRKLEKLCTVNDISPKKDISGTVTFSLWDDFNSTKCGVVVFIQDSSHQIFGSKKFQVPHTI